MSISTDDYAKRCEEILLKTDSPKAYRDMMVFLTLKLAEEVGEVSKLLVQVLFRDQRNTRDQLLDELGDVLFFVTMIARVNGFSLGDVMVRNIEKLENRYGHIASGDKYTWVSGELKKNDG